MKLSDTAVSLLESRFFTPIVEDGESPTWSFNYASPTANDSKPTILLLGAYKHPNTGNNLIGGINLSYLDQQQRDELATVLPKIMQANNLYSRYHVGRRLLPNVFDNFYRTFDAKHIRGVEKGVLYPKKGYFSAAKDFIRQKIGGLYKSKAQRAKDLAPKFPSDLSGMNDKLDQVVNHLNQQQAQRAATGDWEPETPEMVAARKAFQQSKMDRARTMTDIEKQEDIPLQQAAQQVQQTEVQKGNIPPQVAPEVVPQPPEPTPQEIGQGIEQERQEHQQELTDPRNDIDLEESIVYYSPVEHRYIIEVI
jgi:hypothetical protein